MDLRVKIPKKYKKGLSWRFNAKNQSEFGFVFGGIIKLIIFDCQLCQDYLRVGSCGDCPFAKYKYEGLVGCTLWIRKVLGRKPRFSVTEGCVFLIDRGSIKDLKEFRKKAKQYITWTS